MPAPSPPSWPAATAPGSPRARWRRAPSLPSPSRCRCGSVRSACSRPPEGRGPARSAAADEARSEDQLVLLLGGRLVHRALGVVGGFRLGGGELVQDDVE